MRARDKLRDLIKQGEHRAAEWRALRMQAESNELDAAELLGHLRGLESFSDEALERAFARVGPRIDGVRPS